MKSILLWTFGCSVVLASSTMGIPPRNDVRLYRGTSSTDTFDLGVTLLPEAIVKQQFSSEIYRAYVVVEVAFFPKNGVSVDVSRASFSLRNKITGQVAYATLPQTAAGVLQRAASRRTVDVYPEAEIGYGSGGGYDPATGQIHRRGVYTSSGVGIGTGGRQRPGASSQDRQVTQMELADKALPEGAATAPVAGYLYFPITSKKKDTAYEVIFRSNQGAVTISAGHR